VLQADTVQRFTVRRSGLEPLPGCPEGILSPPSTNHKATTYPVIHSGPSLGFVRVGAFRDTRFCYRIRYQSAFAERSTCNAEPAVSVVLPLPARTAAE
jgi:hypothetical protein